MTTTFDTEASKLISAVAKKLKNENTVQPPAWMAYTKTGPHAERAPESPDFWYNRCASILRTLYVRGPIGVNRLRDKYGGRKRHVVSRAHAKRSGGSVIRKALQQLEKAGLIVKHTKGRAISKKGMALLDGSAKKVA